MTAAAFSYIIYIHAAYLFVWSYEFHFGKLDVSFLVCGSIYDHIMNLQYKHFLDSTWHVYIDETADYETIWYIFISRSTALQGDISYIFTGFGGRYFI